MICRSADLGRGMMMGWRLAFALLMCCTVGVALMVADEGNVDGKAPPTRILVDTDMETDDFFALIYLLKQNRSEIDLKTVTISVNSWTDAGHAVNHLYDILYMMGREDVRVGVGGEGAISPNGTIFPDVGGYLPLIEQEVSTVGNCRYRQAIPLGQGGRLDMDTNHGIRRAFLPQGTRRYSPLQQPTAQQVMIDTISTGPTTVLLLGSHTNFAIFLMTNPELKKNVENLFVMGGGINSTNSKHCCLNKAKSHCNPRCGIFGNVFTAFNTNPFAEFNMFSDPFAAYKVFHSGIPTTLVPLDATNTIPITKEFYEEFEKRQDTYEAQYCFQSLKMIHDTQTDDSFYRTTYLWDSFMAGVAASTIRNRYKGNGENEFAVMQDMFITVVTSNPPYGVNDGSNPLFNGLDTLKFNLTKKGVHGGHVQTGIDDPFCLVNNGSKLGTCQDGYTKEVVGSEGVRVRVAQKAKPNQRNNSKLQAEYFASFLDAINRPLQSGRFNFTMQFPFHKEVLYKPDLTSKKLGKPLVFDMDMSPGDFLALMFLLKVPVEEIDIKGILVNGNGWANSATIDMVYDILHMMGRDDIPVGLGSPTAMGTTSQSCTYVRYIPNGGGGFLDSDTLYGLAQDLPRGPRRYSADTSVAHGAPRNTSHPELRQPSALEVWKSISSALLSKGGPKITMLTNGPLTNLANIVLSDGNVEKAMQDVYIVGGHITTVSARNGNVFSVPSNKYSEFNFFLDPIAAKMVLKLNLSITLVPLSTQRKVSSFPLMLESLESTKATVESTFAKNLIATLYSLQKQHPSYQHMDMFLGEILGAVVLAKGPSINATTKVSKIDVLTGDIKKDGQTVISKLGKAVKVLDNLDSFAYYTLLADLLRNESQSAVIGRFDGQNDNGLRQPTAQKANEKVMYVL